VAAVQGDFTGDGLSSLVVINAGDNRVSLLLNTPDGPQIASVLTVANLSSLSDVALGTISSAGLNVYVTNSGDESVSQLTFSLDLSPFTPPTDGNNDVVSANSNDQTVTEFSSLQNFPLGVVGTLFLVGADEATLTGVSGGNEPGLAGVLASNEAADQSGTPSGSADGAAGGGADGNVEPANYVQEEVDGEAAMNLNAFITGSADAHPEQDLTSSNKGDALDASPLPSALIDFSNLPDAGPRPSETGGDNPTQRPATDEDAGDGQGAEASIKQNEPDLLGPVETKAPVSLAVPEAQSLKSILDKGHGSPAHAAALPDGVWKPVSFGLFLARFLALPVFWVQFFWAPAFYRKSRQDMQAKAKI
jgi:hypothetical protein